MNIEQLKDQLLQRLKQTNSPSFLFHMRKAMKDYDEQENSLKPYGIPSEKRSTVEEPAVQYARQELPYKTREISAEEIQRKADRADRDIAEGRTTPQDEFWEKFDKKMDAWR